MLFFSGSGAPKTPNQSLQATAGRSDPSLKLTKTQLLQSTLASASGA